MKTVCFLAVFLVAWAAQADVEFAIPDDGRITLGVFDRTGRLVRTLHRLARQEEFRIGLNGLVTDWDGKNDAGEALPAGRYHLRGYLIGSDVRVSGEAFLFNDFAGDDGFPGFSLIRDFSLLENGDLLLLAEPQPGALLLARVSEDRGFLWSSAAPPDFLPLVAVNSSAAIVISPSEMRLRSLADGNEISATPLGARAAPVALAANGSDVFASLPGGIASIALDSQPAASQILDGSEAGRGVARPPRETLTEAPALLTSMDADASTLIGASADGVWIRKKVFSKVEMPSAVRSLALGMPGTFWFIGVEKDAPFVGQATFGGEILRTLFPAPDDPKPEKIRAARAAEKFAVLESLPGGQRLRVMARSAGGEWTIEWERTILNSASFGFVDGRPCADAGGAPQEKDVRFRLKENLLTGQKDFLSVRVASDGSGSRLVSPDGLPLVDVSSRQGILRTAIRRGSSSGSLRFLQGNGSFVEEFSVAGLDDIFPIDAGEVDVPPPATSPSATGHLPR